ncbi:carbohydrate-binding family 9-like protein [Planctomycetota bacterium]|nr:carbohydrate-binding family 9-like protein [Planctomycetota bacterium]
MKSKMTGLLGAGLVLGGFAMSTVFAEHEKVEVQPRDTLVEGFYAFYTSEEMKMDGDLNEDVWKFADTVPIKYIFRPENFEDDISKTTAKIVWNDEYLFVALECADKDIKSFSTKHDDTLWDGDVAEFFIKPTDEAGRYTEIVIAPNGTHYDGAYDARWKGGESGGRDWESEVVIGTKIDGTDNDSSDDDTGYVVEFKVKLDKITNNKPAVEGDVWRFGAFRYDYAKQWEEPLLLMNIPESKAGFHYHEGYLPLRFVK